MVPWFALEGHPPPVKFLPSPFWESSSPEWVPSFVIVSLLLAVKDPNVSLINLKVCFRHLRESFQVTSRQTRYVPELIKVAQTLSINSSLVIYTLDLSEDQIKEVSWGVRINRSCRKRQRDGMRDVGLGNRVKMMRETHLVCVDKYLDSLCVRPTLALHSISLYLDFFSQFSFDTMGSLICDLLSIFPSFLFRPVRMPT